MGSDFLTSLAEAASRAPEGDRAFWENVRRGLLQIVRAIERRFGIVSEGR